jgi:hypothetical protein
MTYDEIRQGYRKHAAMAQIHRWYQIYENPNSRIENALDILATDIKLKSGLGEAVGHEAYKQRIAQLPKTWKNAHTIKDARFSVGADGAIGLEVDIVYLNQGMRPDGSVRMTNLIYTTQLTQTDTLLPKFTQIEIKQIDESTALEFVDAYPVNRLLSLAHYWVAIIEDPKRDPEPAREILSDGFRLNFSSGPIETFDAFKAWLAGPGSQVVASTHTLGNVSHHVTGTDRYAFNVDFDWQGITHDGKDLAVKTRHAWDVTDNPKERFARIKTMNVEVLEPLRAP